MKLNFWQWIGVVLLIVGVIMAVNKYVLNEPAPTPSTQPR